MLDLLSLLVVEELYALQPLWPVLSLLSDTQWEGEEYSRFCCQLCRSFPELRQFTFQFTAALSRLRTC